MSIPNLTSTAPLPPPPSQPPSQNHQVSTSISHTSRNCTTQGVAQDSRTSQVAAEGGGSSQTPAHGQPYAYATRTSSGKYGNSQRYGTVYGHGAESGGYPSGRGRYPILAGSLILGVLSTILTLISQSVLTHKQGNSFVGYLWFGILLQILIITWVGFSAFKSFPNSPPPSQPIAHLSTIVIILASLAVDRHIHSTTSPIQQATGTGWLLILLVDLFWVVYLSSPPDSAIVRFVDGHHGQAHEPAPNVFGLGPIKGETRRFRPLLTATGTQPSTHRYTIPYPRPQSPLNLSKVLQTSGTQRDPAPVTAPALADIESARRSSAAVSEGRSADLHGQGQGKGPVVTAPVTSTVEGVAGGASRTASAKMLSTPSENVHGAANGSKNGGSLGAGVGAVTLGSLSSTSTSITSEDTRPPSAKGSRANNGLGIKGILKARALYTYKANADDPTELSFTQGELLDILDKSGRWWSVRKSDGSVGIAPSNYLVIHTSFY